MNYDMVGWSAPKMENTWRQREAVELNSIEAVLSLSHGFRHKTIYATIARERKRISITNS